MRRFFYILISVKAVFVNFKTELRTFQWHLAILECYLGAFAGERDGGCTSTVELPENGLISGW
jgi:hypothetical protein